MDNWLDSDIWDLTWQGKPVVSLEQLLAYAHSQYPGSDSEVLGEFARTPAFAKAPDSLARQVLNRIGRREIRAVDGSGRVIRKIPITKRSSKRVYGSTQSIFKFHSSIIPKGTVAVGIANFYPTERSRIPVFWMTDTEAYDGHLFARVIDQLDYEFPGLLEKTDVRSILFITDETPPRLVGGAYVPELRQIRILASVMHDNRVGRPIVIRRSQQQLYYTLLHSVGHAVGDRFTLNSTYGKFFNVTPPTWLETLEKEQQARWVFGATRFLTTLIFEEKGPYKELFAEAFAEYLLAGTTGNEDLDGWVRNVMAIKGITGVARKRLVGPHVDAFTLKRVTAEELTDFLVNEDEAGEGLAPSELARIVALDSIPDKR